LRNDPAVQASLIPLFEDKKEAVRFRAAAGFLRLGMIKAAPPPRKRRPGGKKGA
jgi:hypothetical protein